MMDDQSQSRDRQQAPPVRPPLPPTPPSQSSSPPPPSQTPAVASSVPPSSFTPSPAKKKFGRKQLIFWFLLLSVVSAALGYFFTQNIIPEKKYDPPITAAPTVFVSPTIANILPEEWYPFEANEFNIAFAYPGNWGATTATPLSSVPQTIITFEKEKEDGSQTDVVRFMRFSDYNDPGAERLKSIYLSKQIDSNTPIILPPVSQSLTYFSPVKYIENTNSTLRGMTYFARTAEPEDKPYLNTLVVIMTDGGENIVQFSHQFTTDNEEKNQYPVAFGNCSKVKENAIAPVDMCQVNKGVFESLATYQELASKAAVVHGGQ